jgi:hypothetical protein
MARRVRFLRNYDWPVPGSRLTFVEFKLGMEMLVTGPQADDAIAAGAAEPVEPPPEPVPETTPRRRNKPSDAN